MLKVPPSLLPSLLLLWPLQQAYAANFTFAYSAATQCGNFQVSWQGGVAPFQLTLVPSYGTPRILNIPSSAFSNNHGIFSTTLPILKGKEFMAVMSDSSGFASGGISKVITVGAAAKGSTCNTTDLGVDFFYDTPSALAQCRVYRFDDYTGAVQPIVIKGIVPGGSSFVLNPPKGALFDWTADIAAGTTVSFIMQDANGRQGGASEFLSVGLSDDSTCLDKNSPTSVSNAPSLTISRTATTAATAKPNQTSSQSSPSSSADPTTTSNGGTIAAVIIGTVVALLVLGTLIWFYLRRRNGGTSVLKGRFLGRRFQKQEVDLMKGDSRIPPSTSLSPYPLYHPQDPSGDVSTPNSSSNLLGGRPSDATSGIDAPPSLTVANPRNSAYSSQFPPSVPAGPVHDGSLYGGESAYGGGFAGSAIAPGAMMTAARPDGSVSSWDQSLTSSAARRKAAQAGVSSYQPPARFILHTDIDDDIPPPPEEEVIELPPQYSERRASPRSLSPHVGGSGRSASPQGLAYLDHSHPS